MKNYFSLILSLSLFSVLCITGCSESGTTEPTTDDAPSDLRETAARTRAVGTLPAPTFDEAAAYLGSLGYDTTTLEEYESYFLIESDLMFPKMILAERIEQPTPKMLHGTLLRKEHQRLNLEIQATCNTEILKKSDQGMERDRRMQHPFHFLDR